MNVKDLKEFFIKHRSGCMRSTGLTTLEEAKKEANDKRKTDPGVSLWEKTEDIGARQVNL